MHPVPTRWPSEKPSRSEKARFSVPKSGWRELAGGDTLGAFDDSLGNGVTGETGHVVNVQLVHELLPVFLDGFDADEQFAGDLFVGVAFGDQLQHFQLTRSEFGTLLLAGRLAD